MAARSIEFGAALAALSDLEKEDALRIQQRISEAVAALGGQVADDLSDAVTALDNKVASDISEAVSALEEEVTEEISAAVTALDTKVGNDISQALSDLEEGVSDDLSAAVTALDNKVAGDISEAVADLDEKVSDDISAAVTALDDKIASDISETVSDLDEKVADDISAAVTALDNKVAGDISEAVADLDQQVATDISEAIAAFGVTLRGIVAMGGGPLRNIVIQDDLGLLKDGPGASQPARTLYLGRSLTLKLRGAPLFASPGIGLPSVVPRLEGLTAVTMPATESPIFVWHDFDYPDLYFAAGANPPPVTDRIVPVGVWNGDTFTSANFQVLKIDGVETAIPRSPIFVDGPQVHVPQMVGWSPLAGVGHTGSQPGVTPASPTVARTITVPTSGLSYRLFLNLLGAAAGAGGDAFEEHNFAALPRTTHVEVFRATEGIYSSQFPVWGTGVPGTRVLNQFLKSKSAPGQAVKLGATAEVTLSVAALAAAGFSTDQASIDVITNLGFTKGMLNAATGSPYYGMRTAHRRPKGCFALRAYVLTHADEGTFAPGTIPEAQMFGRGRISAAQPSEVTVQSPKMPLFRRHSPRIREYWISARYLGDYEIMELLCGVATNTGAPVVVFGLQLHYGPTPGYILGSDYPESNDEQVDYDEAKRRTLAIPATAAPLIPDELYVIEERPLTIYREGLVPTLDAGVEISVAGQRRGRGRFPRILRGPNEFVVDAREIEGELTIRATPMGNGPALYWEKIARLCSVSEADLVGLAYTLWAGGDSTAEAGGILVAARDKAIALQMLGTHVGTRTMRSYIHARITLGEARGGTTLAAWAGCETSPDRILIPLPAGQETAYLAMNDAQKAVYNPLLKEASGGTPAAWVNNGHYPSFAWYFQRFDLPVTDFLLFVASINDAIEHNADIVVAEINVKKAVGILGAVAASELPFVPLGFATHNVAASDAGDGVFANRQRVNKALVEATRASLHPNCVALGGHLLQRRHGWNLVGPYPAADAAGVVVRGVPDATHGIAENSEAVGEQIIAWIAVNRTRDAALQRAFERMRA